MIIPNVPVVVTKILEVNKNETIVIVDRPWLNANEKNRHQSYISLDHPIADGFESWKLRLSKLRQEANDIKVGDIYCYVTLESQTRRIE